MLDSQSRGLEFKSPPGQKFGSRFLLACTLANSAMMSTLTVQCQWKDGGTDIPPRQSPRAHTYRRIQYIQAYIHIFMHTIYTYIQSYILKYFDIYIYTRIHTQYTRIHTYVYACLYMYVCICMYIYVNICMRVCRLYNSNVLISWCFNP